MLLSHSLFLTSVLLVAACGGTAVDSVGSSSGGVASASGSSSGSTMTDTTFEGPSVCTSETTGTTRDGLDMNPGRACNACHSTQARRDVMAWAGTVYPTGHEPDQCNGVNGTTSGTEVVVTDAAGTELRLPVRPSGNFSILARDPKAIAMKAPFHVRVERMGRVREMSQELPAGQGDCNSCHTETGTNGAPGRIAVPLL